MTALYNEIEPFAADWLENLIAAGRIAPGVVDRRSIEDLDPDYVRRFQQVHLFAGIGIWSAALRGAGWADGRRIWSISCPCQPFSDAGQGTGFADERHLWPHAFHLAVQCGADVLVGEQVASKDGLAWVDLVRSDLENADYAFAAVDWCAAGVGAPHIRQRLYWCAVSVADTVRDGSQGWILGRSDAGRQAVDGPAGPVRATSGERLALPHDTVGRADLAGGDDNDGRDAGRPQAAGHAGAGGGCGGLAHAPGGGCGEFGGALVAGGQRHVDGGGEDHRPGPVNGGWGAADWLHCRDGRWRPVEPGTFPLAHALPRSMGAMGAGLSGLVSVAGADKRSLAAAKRFRTGTLRGFGNAIVKDQAEMFCATVMELVG